MSDEKLKTDPTGECYGYEFGLTNEWKFHVPSLERTWDTYKEMCAGLERVSVAEKRKKKKAIAIQTVSEDGIDVVITGIHAGTGRFTTKPQFDRYETKALYPPAPSVREALQRLQACRETVESLLGFLGNLEIKQRYWWRGFELGSHLDDQERLDKVAAILLDKAMQAKCPE